MLPRVGDNRDRLFVVPGQHADHERTAFWLKLNAIADPELKHLGMCAHLMQEPQAFDDSIVEVDEFCFCELIDIDPHAHPKLHRTNGFSTPTRAPDDAQ